MKVVKLKKEEWQFFSLLEMQINGGVDCWKEVDGMFGKSVYECDRGAVDARLNITEQDGYSIIVYDEDLFREMYKRIKTMIWKVLVKESE